MLRRIQFIAREGRARGFMERATFRDGDETSDEVDVRTPNAPPVFRFFGLLQL